MATSDRLNLPLPSGTDQISEGDDNFRDGFGILDAAALYTTGLFAVRPDSEDVADGVLYWATDVKVLFLNVADVGWQQIAPNAITPIGSIVPYAGAFDPDDTRWLLADGRAVSRSTYDSLFDVIGETFGSGNGTTTFNLPDLRGRVPVGLTNMGTAMGSAASRMLGYSVARGDTGGDANYTLSTGELPAHTHSVALSTTAAGSHNHGGSTGAGGHSAYTAGSAGSHTHSVLVGGNTAPAGHDLAAHQSQHVQAYSSGTPATVSDTPHIHGTLLGGGTDSQGLHSHSISGSGSHTHSISTVADHSHTVSGPTTSVGTGEAHGNVQPYQATNYLIRVSGPTGFDSGETGGGGGGGTPILALSDDDENYFPVGEITFIGAEIEDEGGGIVSVTIAGNTVNGDTGSVSDVKTFTFTGSGGATVAVTDLGDDEAEVSIDISPTLDVSGDSGSASDVDSIIFDGTGSVSVTVTESPSGTAVVQIARADTLDISGDSGSASDIDQIVFDGQQGTTVAVSESPAGTAVIAISAGASRTTDTYTTASLANLAGESGTIALGKSGLVQRISVDRACRVRLYATTAKRDADVSRVAGTDPTGDHGLYLDIVFAAGDLDYTIAPITAYADMAGSPSGDIAIRVDNLSGSTSTVAVTVYSLVLEA